jgi:hypothetical protein
MQRATEVDEYSRQPHAAAVTSQHYNQSELRRSGFDASV